MIAFAFMQDALARTRVSETPHMPATSIRKQLIDQYDLVAATPYIHTSLGPV